jgi:hypothetical protein
MSCPRGAHLPATGLVEWAVERFLDRLAVEQRKESRLLPGPLVLIAPDGRPATAVIEAFLGRRGLPPAALTERAVVCRGRDLARALERAAAGDRPARFVELMTPRPIIIIDGGEPLGAAESEQGFLSLLDAWTATRASVCISVSDHPANLTGFTPAVASRLAAGLVVWLPAPPVPTTRTPALGNTVTVGRVLRLVADWHDLDVATLVGPRRSRSIVHARSLAMYLARLVTGSSLQAIGSHCGGRDHTTVLHATRTVTARMAADPAVAADVATLVETLSFRRPRGGGRKRDALDDAPPARIGHHFGSPSTTGSKASRRISGRQRTSRRRHA